MYHSIAEYDVGLYRSKIGGIGMLKLFTRMKDEESGQALIFVALMMVVLLGMGSLVIDYGYMAMQKSELQTAADSAALAGAISAKKPDTIANTAKSTAKKNIPTLTDDNIVVNTLKISDGEVKVTISQAAPKFFAGLLTSEVTTISASATAKFLPKWTGEALPFLNMGFDFSVADPTAWTQVAPGIKGDIYDFRTFKNEVGKSYYEIEYKNGIEIKPGFGGGLKGLDDSMLKAGLDDVLAPIGKKVYIFSLRSELIKANHCKVNNEANFTTIDNLNNNDVINPNQLVLLECNLVSYDKSNLHNIKLTYTGNVFDLGNNVAGNDLPDFPTENLDSKITSARLIK